MPDHNFSPVPPFQQGAEFGHFKIGPLLGNGNMGWVFVAEDRILGRQVALKVMMPHLEKEKRARRRFLREARSAASIRHGRIVTVYKAGEINDILYIAMELLDGEPLDEYLKRRPCPPLKVALTIARQVAEGLCAADKRGWIHRDIKPGNVWLCKEGRRRINVRLLDFGLARAAVGDTLSSTNTSAGLGTPLYMAPEQWSGKGVNHQSDIFSLGVMLYQMLTGQTPFVAGERDQLMFQICVEKELPLTPAALNPAVPADLSAFVMRMIARDKQERVATASEVKRVLARLKATLTSPTPPTPLPRPPPTRTPPAPLDCTGPAGASEQTVRQSQRDWASYLGSPVNCPVDLGDGVVMDFVLIPPGTFLMGTAEGEIDALVRRLPPMSRNECRNETPRHRMTITRPMYVGRTPVTRGQFAQFVAAGYRTEAQQTGGGWGWDASRRQFVSKRNDRFSWCETGWPADDQHPVVNITWNDARAFADWLGRRTLPAGFRVPRLPREAEWEYACRAGTTTTYPNGSDDPETLAAIANVRVAAVKQRFPFTSPVASFLPNAFGLYDTIGNVWEWCEDGFDADAYARPAGPDRFVGHATDYRVYRGGSGFYEVWRARPACRSVGDAGLRYFHIGCRLLLPLDPA